MPGFDTGRRLFSVDPVTGIRKWFHWDDTTDEFLIETETPNLDEIVEANKRELNDNHGKWGDGKLVARLPIALWARLKKEGIIDDQKAFKRWLNDPDNRFFRIRPGKI